MADDRDWLLFIEWLQQIIDTCDKLVGGLRGPIGEDEAEQLVDSAKEYLMQGEQE